MKTQEQIRKDVMDYLEKTSIHTFLKPKATFKYGDQNKHGYYEYDYEKGTYFKVFKEGEEWFYIQNESINRIDVEWYLQYYKNNAKCVISNQLFLNKQMKSIKNTKFVRSKIEEVRNSKK